jgi:hypothetical protein
LTVFLFRKTLPEKKVVREAKVEEEEALLPSKILNNRSQYSEKRVVLRARVLPEPVVCERKECPVTDPCCGCPPERDLIARDPGVVLSPKTGERLKLLDSDGHSFCERGQSDCQYRCPGWSENAIYKISGVFYAEPPPPGWKKSLNYYFQVESKELVSQVGVGEYLGNLAREIREWIEKIKTSGYYILQ